MVLGYLVARAGIEVEILEKHPRFLHDFRGDTVHPSTLESMHELGVLEDLLRLPRQRLTKVRRWIGGDEIVFNDMTNLGTHSKFMAVIPQWNFLNFLAKRGSRFPTFHLKMQTEAENLIEEKWPCRRHSGGCPRMDRWKSGQTWPWLATAGVRSCASVPG
jgi:2-polyprenyl-6-methoxyphenol hydroxylase-like FAD-dependent oxidoreductase